jgi:hypothetical protein
MIFSVVFVFISPFFSTFSLRLLSAHAPQYMLNVIFHAIFTNNVVIVNFERVFHCQVLTTAAYEDWRGFLRFT